MMKTRNTMSTTYNPVSSFTPVRVKSMEFTATARERYFP